ncbi:MAG: hypothetical protein ACRC4T_08170 [Cetobacterium sp.]
MIKVLTSEESQSIWKKIRSIVLKDLDYYKFFIGSAKDVSQLGRDIGLEKIEFISITRNSINGYFSYIYDSNTRTAKGFEMLSFEKDKYKNIIFLKDFAEVIKCLHESPDYERLEVEIIESAPSMSILEHLVKLGTFRKVGEKHKCIRLNDNKLYDILIYEHLKEV